MENGRQVCYNIEKTSIRAPVTLLRIYSVIGRLITEIGEIEHNAELYRKDRPCVTSGRTDARDRGFSA